MKGDFIIGGVNMIIETLKCNCNDGEVNIEYIYKLIQRDLHLNNNEDDICIKAYGVEVESKIKEKDKIVQAVREEIKYVTPYKYKGSQFLHMLEKNMVSPIHLTDITEELIEDYYKDFDKELYVNLDKVTV